MNNNNLENEKLPEDMEGKAEETTHELPVEEKVSEESVEIISEEPAETENIAESNAIEAEPEKEPEPESESESETQPKPDEPVIDEEKEIDYDMETPENANGEDEDAEDEVDENSVSDEGSTDLLSVDEIVQNLRDLLALDNPQRKDVDEVKNQFYRSLRNETESQKAAFIESGGESIDFVANESKIYDEGKELIQKIKEKRAEILALEDAEKEKNVVKKLAIIEQVKHLSESQSHEDFNKTYQEFRSLQQQWNDIKLVPQTKINELWKEYQRHVEKFYDLVRINNEFREYDFKKNLEMKTELCEAAERLDEEADVVSAFHQLQNLHQEWRDIGPVSRKDREEIWERFKAASTHINKKYQAHFENLKEKEEENLAKKTALCERLEAIDYSALNTVKDWSAKIKEVLDIQKQWREIGYVPKNWNAKIYDRYRAACDFFFRKKNEFYKSIHSEMEDNLKKKIALCERAEAIKDSKDWRKTTQNMIAIQKEWRTIGIVPRKHVDSIWKRFISACDYFFEQKKLHISSQRDEEAKNLEKKKEIVEKISKIDPTLKAAEALPVLRELMDEWYDIGYVPFKTKDWVYKEFHEATEAQFDRLNVDKNDRILDNFKSNISDIAKSDNAKGQLLRERERLMRQYERMKNELQTYENNIGFLSVSSKKGNNLVDDMNQKVKKIKSELELLVKKIAAIDEEL
ncbi:MAG: DUF349 domain-containing protein [Bacteroidia bacterium]|nr:DUF349 domain-containing protein [Bacteroidia bacterium]